MAGEEQELRSKIAALMVRKYGSGDHSIQLFSDYDWDQDGECIAAEIEQLLDDANVGNFMTRRAWVAGLLERLDVDYSGGVTYSELRGALVPMPMGPAPPSAPPPMGPPPPPPAAPRVVPPSSSRRSAAPSASAWALGALVVMGGALWLSSAR